MGERASIAYVEDFAGEDSRVFFYGHWIADGTIDILCKALEGTTENLPAKIAKFMGEDTDDQYDITPYMIIGNYPTLYVRQIGGAPEVALADSESAVDSTDLVWIEADDFVAHAERSRSLDGYDRFLFINALIMGY